MNLPRMAKAHELDEKPSKVSINEGMWLNPDTSRQRTSEIPFKITAPATRLIRPLIRNKFTLSPGYRRRLPAAASKVVVDEFHRGGRVAAEVFVPFSLSKFHQD